MEKVFYTGILREIAEKGLANQVKRNGDYYDSEGLLVCGKCGERRQTFVEIKSPTPEDPNRKTWLKAVKQCPCDIKEHDELLLAEAKVRLRKMSMMDSELQNARFENLKITNYNKDNIAICKGYCKHFEEMVERGQGLLFWGRPGVGKSYAAACIANQLIDSGVMVMMSTVASIISKFTSDWNAEEAFIQQMKLCPLVIFDDFRAERSTEYSIEKVCRIIDERVNMGLPMIVTTNLSLDEIAHETDIRYIRIYDRILGKCRPYQFTGTSWRQYNGRNSRDLDKILLE